MAEYIEFHGASGTTYRYLAPDDRSAARMAGGYVLVSRVEETPGLLYVGVTDDLGDGWRDAWLRAQESHESVQLFVHRTVSRQIRDAERADIVAAYDPPMNRDERG